MAFDVIGIVVKFGAFYNSLSRNSRGFWFVFRAFKQVPKSTLISALKKKPRREYNHLGWSICAALRLAITGFFDP